MTYFRPPAPPTRAPFAWHNQISQLFMERDYLLPGQTLVERVALIANHAEQILRQTGERENDTRYAGYAAKFTDYLSRGWYSLSTPIWTNFGTNRGYGISCFGGYLADTMESILEAQAEVGMLSKNGGGTSGYFGNLRGRGAPIKDNGFSSGAVHMMRLFENQTNVISQGSARRGQFAAYLDIDHPDVLEFLEIRSEGNPLQEISFGLCIGTDWLTQMRQGDQAKRIVWAKVHESRAKKGYPYLFFTDNVNKGTVDVYKDKGMKITHSNLCSEICLVDNVLETFVCDLASMNVLHFEEYEHTDAVEVLVALLDAVMSDFIKRASGVKFMERAVRFAERHRALGVGQLGWHSFLQANSIPFESTEAKLWNVRVAQNMQRAAYAASAKLAEHFGEPELLRGYGRRHATLLAIAPTTSSAFILGQVSQSIEPWNSNYFVKDLAKVKHTIRNPHLEAVLAAKGNDTTEIWQSILMRGGSVQHLPDAVLDAHEKAVFKTFSEISQREVVIQAAQRQKYIDQSQSLNLMIHPSIPVKEVNALVLEAHDLGVKTLYYQHSVNAAQEFSRNLMECASCQ